MNLDTQHFCTCCRTYTEYTAVINIKIDGESYVKSLCHKCLDKFIQARAKQYEEEAAADSFDDELFWSDL